jgi:hypothetical protein
MSDREAESWIPEPLPGTIRWRGRMFGEFVCPGCGGFADVFITEVRPKDWNLGAQAITWYEPWHAYVTVELVCQGPVDLDAPNAAWDHAGTTIDMIATGYEPIGLN